MSARWISIPDPFLDMDSFCEYFRYEGAIHALFFPMGLNQRALVVLNGNPLYNGV